MAFEAYDPENFYDELFLAPGKPRSHSVTLIERMAELGIKKLEQQRQTAEIAFFKLGVTFNVYNDNQGIEKIFPFDIIPYFFFIRITDSKAIINIPTLNSAETF